MNWVNKHKLPAIEAIKYNDQQCLNIDDLWNVLYSIFNTALHCQVNIKILDEIPKNQSPLGPHFQRKSSELL